MATANFLTTFYPENYFSHIIIDECHRFGLGQMVASPHAQPGCRANRPHRHAREIEVAEKSKEATADLQITADNLKHFGEPVYEYDMAQGIEDGYLAACEIHRVDLFLENKTENERVTGVWREDFKGKRLNRR